jgi:hypothetical protein
MRNTPKLPLPSNITTAITSFTPYFFDNSSVEGFKLIEDSVSYQAGVLVFTMKNDKSSKTLIFTEQKTPGNYDIGSLRGDKEFKTQYGQAFITDGTARTTGTLFTDDKTWILINAPQPIGADAMQKILSSLTSR